MKFHKTVKFALKTIRSNKMRMLIVIFGLVIALSLIISVFFWANTSERIILTEFVDNTDYLFYANAFIQDTVFDIFDYLKNNTLIENFDLSLQSYALFNVGDKNETYRFYPFNNQQDPEDPLVVSNTVLTNITAMADHLNNVFKLDGQWPTAQNQIVMSQLALDNIGSVLNQTLGIGSIVDLSIGRRIPYVDNGENQLYSYNKKDFENFTITGVIDYKSGVGSIKYAYSEESLENLVIIPLENLVFDDMKTMDHNAIRITAMVQFYIKYIYEVGINNLDQLYERLNDQIKSRFWTAVTNSLYRESIELQQLFNFSFNSVYYYIPLLFLSLLLSDQASAILLNDREKQIEIIRKKGATDVDLTVMLSLEFVLITVIGILIGLPSSIILSAFIPAVTKKGTIDIEMFFIHLDFIDLDFSLIYLAVIAIVGIFITSSLIKISRLINPPKVNLNSNSNTVHYNLELEKIVTENQNSKTIQRLASYFKFNKQLDRSQIIRLVLTLVITSIVLVMVYDLTADNNILEVSQDPNFRFVLTLILILFNLLWIFYFQYVSNLVFYLLNKLNFLIKLFFPIISFLVIKNLSNKKNRTRVLVFYVIFILTLVTMSSTLISIYRENENEANLFLQGADLRISTINTNQSYVKDLESVEGIANITPIHRGIGRIVGSVLSIFSVNPEEYLEIGYWDNAQYNGSIVSMMTRLESGSKYNILISNKIAHRLSYEVGDTLYLSGYQNTLLLNLTVQGIIDTAPGLGISSSPNPEVDSDTGGWAILPLSLTEKKFNLNIFELFLGKLKGDAVQEDVKERLEGKENVIGVNKFPIFENNILVAVNVFLPSSIAILLLIKFLTFIFSIILLTIIIETLLKQRKKEIAILISIGNKPNHIKKAIAFEFYAILLVAIFLSSILGLLVSQIALSFFIQLTIKRVFVPINFSTNYVELISNSIIFIIIFSLIFWRKLQVHVNRSSIWEIDV